MENTKTENEAAGVTSALTAGLGAELEREIRAAINPLYADVRGTESYERKRLLGEIDRLREAMSTAYGYLWHVNNEPMAPIPLYSPETAAREARKVLRDLMTNEQRGEAINRVQKLLGHND